MTLKESLDKFNQQQAKCQSTLTSLRSRAGPFTTAESPRHKAAIPAATFSSIAAAMAPTVKFSNDTERLQHINTIRKSPVGAQIKRVIDMLLETRQAFTPEEINRECYVDVTGNQAVFDSLKNNLKVYYDGNRFSYKDLKAAGHVWLPSSFDSQEDVLYSNDPGISIKVDGDLKLLFRGIELPHDMIEIENSLQKNGMKPATDTAKRRAAAQVTGINPKSKGKKKQISKRLSLQIPI